jgi:hypothetical protein
MEQNAWNRMHGTECMEQNAWNRMHGTECMEQNAWNRMTTARRNKRMGTE